MKRIKKPIKYMDREFFDLETYALFSALNEIVGKKAWEIALRGGEYAFAEVRKRLGIAETDPIALVKRLGKWLERMGYARIEIEKTGENEFLYTMYDTASRRGLRQTRKEKGEDAVLAHWSTVLMFAALKEMCKMKAEISHLDFAKEDKKGPSVEKWTLSKLN
jgi:bifunctional DNA-binding transcriptional regulator/antitoxin component of YhaV-PrlF toxin-antitoxin module